MTPLDHIKAELSRIHDLMAATPDPDWDKPSACGGFQVRDVVGHLVAGRRVQLPTVFLELFKHGLRFNAAAATVSKRESLHSRKQLLEGLLGASGNPRGVGISRLQPMKAMFADVVTHHEDIRWGLGERRTMPTDVAQEVLTTAVQLRGPGSWGTAKRAKGVTLQATDVDWSWGQGPPITGTADALLLGLGGRTMAHAELSGAGLSRW